MTLMHSRTSLSNSQLFLDDSWIADSAFISRSWHTPRKHPDPVIKADHPWENHCPVMYGTVLRLADGFHAWYPSWTRDIPMCVCYARSDNGIDWSKPELGLHEVFGSRQNNIVLTSDSAHCIIDDLTVIHDPADRKWPLKMLYWDGMKVARTPDGPRAFGCHLARSRDGIAWDKCGQVLHDYGDRFNALPVKFKGRFHALVREPAMTQKYPQQRVASYVQSKDLKHWSPPSLALTTDTEDPPCMEIYSIVPFLYEGLVMGGIERMHKSPDKLDTEIIWSRDGVNWKRSRTRPSFIPWGAADRWDDTWINLSSSQPIRVGNDLWFYYSGRHGAHYSRAPRNFGGIGLATLRADGFCSIHAIQQPGWFHTPAFTWPGGELLINADCRRDLNSHPKFYNGSNIRLEVRDARGQPIKGYTLADCIAYGKNTWHATHCFEPIRWTASKRLDALRGRKIQLHFTLQDAHLFAFKAGAHP